MEDVKELIWFDPRDVLPKKNVHVLIELDSASLCFCADYNQSPYYVYMYIDDNGYGFAWRNDAGEALYTSDIRRWAYIPKSFRED